ncbi:hypothetical protein [Aquimarina algiphila]|uniref:hypothetical protein n=1 Tax=Aquimarina algiphila TaxID=2047982 RepID=UPI0024902E9D|nr:hypothetical protein [Aquimarina algiphila]
MNAKTKYIIGIGITLILTIAGFVIFGLFLMDNEDTYGDLVYFNKKVENGDIIFRCKKTDIPGSITEFNEFGIIEKSWNKVYVWDNQSTMKKNLYEWAGNSNGERVRVFRIKKTEFDMNDIKKVNGNYNYLMDSGKMNFVIENY